MKMLQALPFHLKYSLVNLEQKNCFNPSSLDTGIDFSLSWSMCSLKKKRFTKEAQRIKVEEKGEGE